MPTVVGFVEILPDPVGRMAWIRPDGKLRDAFDGFRNAVAGAHYDRKRRMHLSSVDRVPTIVRKLRLADFAVEVEESILAQIPDRSAERWMELQAVRDRVNATDRELNTRGESLRPYQRTGAVWLGQRRGALLLDGMRTGKTIQTLVAIPAGAPVVVICPASVKGGWAREIERWRPSLRPTVLSGLNSFRAPRPNEVVIANYRILPSAHEGRCDGFKPRKPCLGCADEVSYANGVAAMTRTGHARDCDGFAPKVRCPGCATYVRELPKGVVVVIDEAHNVKNDRSEQGERAMYLGGGAVEADGRVWLLTGTPLENRPLELWTLLRLARVELEIFPLGKEQFVEAFGGEYVEKRVGRRKVVRTIEWKEPKPEAVELLKASKATLRRTRDAVWGQMAPKQWKRVAVPLDKKALSGLETAIAGLGGLEELVRAIETEKNEAAAIARERAKLAAAKIPALLEYLENLAGEEPVVVFSVHRAAVDVLERMRGWAAIHGDVPPAVRTRIVADFKAGRYRGIACTIQAAGEGLDLSVAEEAIFVDLSWKPTANEQAEDRLIHLERPGPRFYTILEADHPVDKRVVEVCMRKRRLIQSTVDASSATEDVAGVVLDPELARLAAEVEAEVRANPRTVRREAVTDDERAVEEALRDVAFGDLGRDRLATMLSEETAIVGLTDKGWILAAELVASRARKVAAGPSVGQSASQVDTHVRRTQGAKRPGETNARAEGEGEKEEDKMTNDEDEGGEGEMVEPPKAVVDVLEKIGSLSIEYRAILFEILDDEYCLGTGISLVEDQEHACESCGEPDDDEAESST